MLKLVDIVMQVEGGDIPDPEALLEAVSVHRESLRRLQGSWGRFIADLEERGAI